MHCYNKKADDFHRPFYYDIFIDYLHDRLKIIQCYF